jgi:hypothetical protein
MENEQKIEESQKTPSKRAYDTRYKTISLKLPKEIAEAFIDKCFKEKKLPSEKLREFISNFLSNKEIKENKKEEKNEWEGW